MQTAHNINMPIAYPGMRADIRPDNVVISRLCEEATGLLAGTFVKAGTDPATQIKAPTTGTVTGLKCKGLVLFDSSKPVVTGANAGKDYDVKEMVPCLTKGQAWARLETGETPADGEQVFVRIANAGAGEGVGFVRNDADGGDAEIVSGVVFRGVAKTVTLFGTDILIALVELNLPMIADTDT